MAADTSLIQMTTDAKVNQLFKRASKSLTLLDIKKQTPP